MRAKIFVNTCTLYGDVAFLKSGGGQGPPTRNPGLISAWEGGDIHMRAHACLTTALLTFIIVPFSITITLSLFSSRGEILKIY